MDGGRRFSQNERATRGSIPAAESSLRGESLVRMIRRKNRLGRSTYRKATTSASLSSLRLSQLLTA